MSELTMERVAALSVQYWHYSLEYFLDSMVKCGIKNIEFWPGEPHYYRGVITCPRAKRRKGSAKSENRWTTEG